MQRSQILVINPEVLKRSKILSEIFSLELSLLPADPGFYGKTTSLAYVLLRERL